MVKWLDEAEGLKPKPRWDRNALVMIQSQIIWAWAKTQDELYLPRIAKHDLTKPKTQIFEQNEVKNK